MNKFNARSIDFGTGNDQIFGGSIPLDTSNFDGLLSVTENDVQKALDKLDDIGKSDIGLSNVTNDAQIPKSIVTAKGDIITATDNATPVRQSVGSNGQIIVADSNLTNGIGYKDPSFRNWVMNGNMEVAQRGTSFTNPAVGAYSIDRFRNSYNKTSGTWPSTIIHSQEKLSSGDIPGSFYFHRVALSDAGSSLDVNSYYRLHYFIEHGTKNLCGNGKKITLSFYARSSISGEKLGIWIVQTYGTGGSPSASDGLNQYAFSLTSSWTKYTYTFTSTTISGKTFGINNDDSVNVMFYLHYGGTVGGENVVFAGAGNIDIAQVALYAGDVAYPFEPVPYDIELLRCMRFYEKSYSYGAYAGATSLLGCCMGRAIDINYCDTDRTTFKVIKRISPTVNIYNGVTGVLNSVSDFSTGADVALSSSNYQNDRQACGNLYCAGGFTAGHTYLFHYTADADF